MAQNMQLESEGGYDYEFVKKFEDIEDEDLVCPICQLVSRDPQQSECCGKVFCKVCVDKLVLSSLSETISEPCCPNCRKDGVSFFADKRTSRSVFNLKVYCLRKTEGCKWQGALREVETHSEKCDFEQINCPNTCGQKLQRRHMATHVKSFCCKRRFQCVDCKKIDLWEYITGEHVKECPEKLIMCGNNGCGKVLKRHNMKGYHQFDCPKQMVHCSYRDLGCVVTFKREERAEHEKENMARHLKDASDIARNIVTVKKDHLLQTTPVILSIHNFSQSKELKSQAFLTSSRGYKLCLLVEKSSSNKSISISFRLMPGMNDDILSWPFHGEIDVKLLNQVEDNYHCVMSVQRVVCKDYDQKILIGSIDTTSLKNVLDKSKEHAGSRKYSCSECLEKIGYLLNDTLCISVSYEPLKSSKLKEGET